MADDDPTGNTPAAVDDVIAKLPGQPVVEEVLAHGDGARAPERRGRDRRGLGFNARRQDDRDVHRRLHDLVLEYVLQLDDNALRTWISRVVFGNVTEAQLAIYFKAIIESERTGIDSAHQGPRPVGPSTGDDRLPGFPDVPVRTLSYQWRVLTRELASFSRARRQHWAKGNVTRQGTPRSLDIRDRCRQSAIGHHVDLAGLFEEFFDATDLGPQEMAARLLHGGFEQRLRAFEQGAREQASQASSPDDREYWSANATAAAAQLQRFPSWRTLFDHLRQKPSGVGALTRGGADADRP